MKLQLVQESKAAVAPKPLLIRGYPSNVERARLFFLNHYASGDCTPVRQPTRQYVTQDSFMIPQFKAQIRIPQNAVGKVIGRGGENLRRICYETGVAIDLKNGKVFERKWGADNTIVERDFTL